MEFLLITVALTVVIVSLLVFHVISMSWKNGVFQRMSVVGPAPWPAIGNFPELLKLGVSEFQRTYHQKYAGHKVYGYFEPGKPLLAIRDLDMLKDITVKHFNSFVNRRPSVTDETPFNHTLLSLTDDHWRNVRQTVSPTFSTGKLRRMCLHVEQSARTLASNFKDLCKAGTEVELKDIFSCYTMDVIAATGFGVQIESVKDRSNSFLTEGRKIMSFSGLVVSLTVLFPSLVKFLNKFGFRVFPKDSVQFFSTFVDHAIENRTRDKEQHRRVDFLQLMIDGEKLSEGNHDENEKSYANRESRQLSNADIQGQALIFFLAGFDTVSSVISFSLFTFANHPEVLSKIQHELDTVLDGKFPTYDLVQNLHYLDMCLNESMRMFPPAIFVDRVCNTDCTVQGIQIEKGMAVAIPIFAIHRDPAHWPNPDNFDPERFTDENKAERHPFAHIPFGQGPRNCVGMRLALIEMKIALAAILQDMTPVLCEKSVYPPVLSKYILRAEDGLWVKIVSRRT